jgi:hypothetical protein
MLFGSGSGTLSLTMAKQLKEESSFQHPPLWIHVAEAGKWLLSPREARKRAVIRILDRVKARARSPVPRAKI